MRLFVAGMGLLAATAVTIGAAAADRANARTPLPLLLHQAAHGDAPSLRAVAALRRGSDGARSEAIDQTLSAALATKPTAVLGLIVAGNGLPGADWYCQDRAIEPGAAAHARFIRKAISAVGAVHDARLGSTRARCLAALHEAAGARTPS